MTKDGNRLDLKVFVEYLLTNPFRPIFEGRWTLAPPFQQRWLRIFKVCEKNGNVD